MSRRHFFVFLPICLVLLSPGIAVAAGDGEIFPTSRVWQVRFDESNTDPVPLKIVLPALDQDAQARPQALEHGGLHDVRRKIHMIASYATIPLFVGEYLAGESFHRVSRELHARRKHESLSLRIL